MDALTRYHVTVNLTPHGERKDGPHVARNAEH